ncbi:MAG: M28 family peptidase [Polyangiaceae bacterium]
MRSRWLLGAREQLRRTSIARIFLMLVGAWGLVALYVVQPMWPSASPNSPIEVSPDRLRSDVEALVALSPRDTHSTGNARVAEHIERAFRDAGLEPERQPFSDGDDELSGTNIVAHVGPADGPRVVVGAHYDACGPHPGADDNASGVAALLELARLLAKAPPASRVDLVAYANEEPPHFGTTAMGSAHHAAQLADSGVAVTAMISLEMVGYFTDAPDSQSFPVGALELLYPTTGNFIAIIGRVGDATLVRRIKGAMRATSPLRVESINAPSSIPGVDYSDHRSYWELDMPAIMVTDTAFYRNANYHQKTDTPDTLDYPRMAEVVRGVHAAIVELARR